jgi:hypothetical protein
MEFLAYIQEFAAGFVYLAVGIRLYRLSRRTNRSPERRLGLCDALTCERFRLWGIAGAVWFLPQWIVTFQYVEYETTRQWGGFMGALVGFFEVVPVSVVWFVFHPPGFHRDWVDRRYAPV